MEQPAGRPRTGPALGVGRLRRRRALGPAGGRHRRPRAGPGARQQGAARVRPVELRRARVRRGARRVHGGRRDLGRRAAGAGGRRLHPGGERGRRRGHRWARPDRGRPRRAGARDAA